MQLTLKQQGSYAMGGFGKNLAYGLVSSYTLFYYSTVLGVSPAFVGSLLMAARIFDAFNDPFMGIVVARTKTRWGKYKPWLFTGTLLNVLVTIAMFWVPQSLTPGGVKFYITVTYLLCGITYTLGDIPYWALIPALTKPGKDREKLTLMVRLASGIGSGMPLVFTITLVALLGGGSSTEAYRTGFRILAVILSVFYFAMNMIMVKVLPLEPDADQKPVTVKQLITSLLKNDQALLLTLVLILFYTAMNIAMNLAIYLFRYDIGHEERYIFYTVAAAAGQFIGMMVLYPLMRKHFSKRKIFLTANVAAGIGFAILTVLAISRQMGMISLILSSTVVTTAFGLVYILTTVLLSNAVEYGEAKTGHREESMISSLQTFLVKLSSAFAVFISGIGLDLIRLDDSLARQAEVTVDGLRYLYGAPALVLIVVSLIIVYRNKQLR